MHLRSSLGAGSLAAHSASTSVAEGATISAQVVASAGLSVENFAIGANSVALTSTRLFVDFEESRRAFRQLKLAAGFRLRGGSVRHGVHMSVDDGLGLRFDHLWSNFDVFNCNDLRSILGDFNLRCGLKISCLRHIRLRHDLFRLGDCWLGGLAGSSDRALLRLFFASQSTGGEVVDDGLVNTFAGLARIQCLAFWAHLPALDQREAHACLVVEDFAFGALRLLH